IGRPPSVELRLLVATDAVQCISNVMGEHSILVYFKDCYVHPNLKTKIQIDNPRYAGRTAFRVKNVSDFRDNALAKFPVVGLGDKLRVTQRPTIHPDISG